jgi:hypothetical protein
MPCKSDIVLSLSVNTQGTPAIDVGSEIFGTMVHTTVRYGGETWTAYAVGKISMIIVASSALGPRI